MTLDPIDREALLAAIPEATARGHQALADWDAVSDSLCDENHEPLDERYDIRQHQRDAEAWAAFEPFLDHGPQLLAQAEEDLRALHQDYENPDINTIARRRSQLTALHNAVEAGRKERAAWEYANEMILRHHPRGPEFRRRAEILRNAEGWHYAITFADNADVLVEIDQATRARPAAGRARAAQAEAARSRSTTTATPTTSPPATAHQRPRNPAPSGHTARASANLRHHQIPLPRRSSSPVRPRTQRGAALVAEAPHITIGHHPHAGVVAAPSLDHHVTDHLLRRVGFERLPDSRLYALTEPQRDPVRRTQLAVQSLRAAHQNVSADAAYDLHPGERPLPRRPPKEPPLVATSPQQRRVQAATARSPARTATAASQTGPLMESAYRHAPAAARQPAHHR